MTAKTNVTTLNPAVDVPAPITPMQMLQIAVERNADLEKLSKLMDLQERWEANEARKAFVAAKAAFRAEAPTISKNKHVGFKSKDRSKADTDYHHATLDNVADSLGPILGKHGLTYSWETEQLDGGMIRVTCVLSHQLGHCERVALQGSPDQTGNKNNIQAVGSTVTYLQRYTLLSITGTATKDQDDDGGDDGAGALISPEQKETLIALVKDVEADTAAFLKYFGYVSLDAIPAALFDRAVAALEKKRNTERTK